MLRNLIAAHWINVSALLGMLITSVLCTFYVASMLWLKSVYRLFGGADGRDDQRHLAWYGEITLSILPFVLLFLVFWRIKRKTANVAKLSKREAVFYGAIAAIGVLNFALEALTNSMVLSAALILLGLPLLLFLAIWENWKCEG